MLEYVVWLVLQIQSFGVSTTQGSNRIPLRSSNENSVLIVKQKPEALNLTTDSAVIICK